MNNLLPKEINVGGLLYRVYKSGRVYSVLTGRQIAIGKDAKGYSRIHVGCRGGQYNFYQHRLLADLFIPNPENKPEINHKNGIKTDNRLDNLEWVTRQENVTHANETGLVKSGQDAHKSKIKNVHVFFIRNMIKIGMSQSEIAKLFSLSQTAICLINTGKNWKRTQIIEAGQNKLI